MREEVRELRGSVSKWGRLFSWYLSLPFGMTGMGEVTLSCDTFAMAASVLCSICKKVIGIKTASCKHKAREICLLRE